MDSGPQDIEVWIFRESEALPKGRRVRLRELLAQYLKADSNSLEFSEGPHGKPALKKSAGNLKFNLSHSGDYSAYAFAKGIEVGIDIEKIRDNLDQAKIASRLFSKENQRRLGELSGEEKTNFFFKLWTFHEAYLKALGASVFHAPKIASLISFNDPSDKNVRGSDFVIHEFEVAEGYRGAIAALCKDIKINRKN